MIREGQLVKINRNPGHDPSPFGVPYDRLHGQYRAEQVRGLNHMGKGDRTFFLNGSGKIWNNRGYQVLEKDLLPVRKRKIIL